MAVTYTVQEDAGILTDLGRNGFVRVNYVLDGSATSKATTLASTSSVKTIYAVFGGQGHGVDPVAGVAGTTGFTLKFAAGSNADHLSALVYGAGR